MTGHEFQLVSSWHSLAGIQQKILIPLSSSDSNQILPPAFSTYLFTIDNPSPVPDDLVVKFGVNIFFLKNLGIPVPLSAIETTTFLVTGSPDLPYDALPARRN